MKSLFSAAVVFAICQFASAQSPVTVSAPVPAPTYSTPPSLNTWIEPHHASTVMESVDRGRAAVIRSAGEYARNTAAAEIDLRTAERMGIDNYHQSVNAKWNIQDSYQMRVKEQYRPLSPEMYGKIARDAAPKRLSVSQLSPEGAIRWPSGLLDDGLAPYRSRLEGLFSARARGMSDVDAAANAADIRLTSDSLLEQLRLRINWLSGGDFVIAKKFVVSLQYEVTARE